MFITQKPGRMNLTLTTVHRTVRRSEIPTFSRGEQEQIGITVRNKDLPISKFRNSNVTKYKTGLET